MPLSSLAIDKLVARVGWAPLTPPAATGLSVDAPASDSDSGRMFNGFHKLATAENVFAAIPNPRANSNTDLNNALVSIRKQAVLKVVSSIFNNPKALYGTDTYGNVVDNTQTDYSDKVIALAGLFDDAIGYQGAMDVIELLISTPRLNPTQRAAGLAVSDLGIVLYGSTDGAGTRMDNGLAGKRNAALKAILDAFFFGADGKTQSLIVDISSGW